MKPEIIASFHERVQTLHRNNDQGFANEFDVSM